MRAAPVLETFRYHRPAAPRWPVAVKAATAMALPLGIGAALGHLETAFLASSGAFTVLYAPMSALRYRVRLMGTVAVALVTCVALGTMTAGHPVVAILVMAGVGAVASFLCNALVVGPPGAYFFVLVVGVAGMITGHGVPTRELVLMAAAGATSGFLVGMSDLAIRPHGPEERAVGAAEAAVARYETAEPDAQEGPRAAASAALHAAWTAVRDGGSAPGLVARAESVEARYVATTARLVARTIGLPPRPWGAVEAEDDRDERDPAERDAEADLALDRDDRRLVRETSLGRPHPFRLLALAARWPGEKPLLVLRTVLAIVVAGGIAAGLGNDHAYWAAGAGALILHQGGTRVAQTQRGVQRFVGTLAGLGVFAVLHSGIHALWQTALAVVVLQLVVELLVVRSYAVAVVVITPLALTIGSAGGPVDIAAMVRDRGIDTALGVAVALGVLWSTGRGTAVPILRAHARRVVDAVHDVLDDLAQERSAAASAVERRRMLYLELLSSDDVARRALVDEPEAVRPYRRMERSLAELGYLVLGLCWHPDQVHDPRAVAAARDALGRIRATDVRVHRPADDIAADVEAALAVLRSPAGA